MHCSHSSNFWKCKKKYCAHKTIEHIQSIDQIPHVVQNLCRTSGNLHGTPRTSQPHSHPRQDASHDLSDAESILYSLYDEGTPDSSPLATPVPHNVPEEGISGPGRSMTATGPSVAAPAPSTRRAKQTKRRLEKPFEREINLLGQMATKEIDASEHFGMLVASKHRQCAAHLRCEMEIEMLQVAARYLNIQ
ncbi:hypothetical protein HPB48_015978 [Haemaphysalis longicornis]|uniref:Uncharacterized protein n=1 Tax=Haemaphysalis longicornis TaxID=44386 RepID=A0A9J6GD15_HAELO|nr:hypothetical protein HPB48_015978 [Haemaphysalis longicornis]